MRQKLLKKVLLYNIYKMVMGKIEKFDFIDKTSKYKKYYDLNKDKLNEKRRLKRQRKNLRKDLETEIRKLEAQVKDWLL